MINLVSPTTHIYTLVFSNANTAQSSGSQLSSSPSSSTSNNPPNNDIVNLLIDLVSVIVVLKL